MTKQTKVVQSEGVGIPTEVIAKSIRDIAAGIKQIRAGALNDKALVMLIQHASGVNQREVKNVLWALDNLAAQYLKKKP